MAETPWIKLEGNPYNHEITCLNGSPWLWRPLWTRRACFPAPRDHHRGWLGNQGRGKVQPQPWWTLLPGGSPKNHIPEVILEYSKILWPGTPALVQPPVKDRHSTPLKNLISNVCKRFCGVNFCSPTHPKWGGGFTAGLKKRPAEKKESEDDLGEDRLRP